MNSTPRNTIIGHQHRIDTVIRTSQDLPILFERSEEFTKYLFRYDGTTGGNHTRIAGSPNPAVELSILLFNRIDHIPKNSGTRDGNGSVISMAAVFHRSPQGLPR